MWIPILVGVGAGLLVAMVVIARQEKRYRVLFSDTHLTELVSVVEATRTGAPATTFEGITVAWERMRDHSAVTLDSRASLADPAARFLLSFISQLVGTQGEALKLGKRQFAALWPREVMDRPITPPADLNALRVEAANAIKALPLVEGTLAAYR